MTKTFNKCELIITYSVLLILSIIIFWVLWLTFNYAWLLVIIIPIVICIYFQARLLTEWDSVTWKILRFCSTWYVKYFGDSCGYYIIFLPEVTGVAVAAFIFGFVISMIISPVTYWKYSSNNSAQLSLLSERSTGLTSVLVHSDPDTDHGDFSQNDCSNITNPHLTKFDYDLNIAVFGENKNTVAEELKGKLYGKKKFPDFLYKKHNTMVDVVEKAYNDLLKKYSRDYSIDTERLKKISRKYKEYVGCGELISMYHGASAAAKGNFDFDSKAFARSVTLNDAVAAYKDFFILVQGVKYYPLACCDSYMLFCYHDNGGRKYKLIYNCSDYQSEVIIQKNELAYYNMFFEGKYIDYTEKTTLAPGPDFMKRYTYYANALGYLNDSLEKDLTTYFNI